MIKGKKYIYDIFYLSILQKLFFEIFHIEDKCKEKCDAGPRCPGPCWRKIVNREKHEKDLGKQPVILLAL